MAGIIFPAMTRVAVFIDYQNVYKSARSAFLLDGHGHLDGQVYPRRVGLLVVVPSQACGATGLTRLTTGGSGTTSTTRLKCPSLRRPTRDPFFKLTHYSAGERSKAPRYSLGQASRSARPTQGSTG